MRRVANIFSSFRARRDGGGTSVPQQLTAIEPSVHFPDVGKQIHVNEQHTQQIKRGSLQGTKEPELVNTNDLEADDIVIAVMGPTGSGKSMFVSAATGCNPKALDHTNEVSAVKFRDQESGRHIVLVDTPGFDDTFKSDLDILNLISEWLVSSYKKKKPLSGILYFHRITDNRVAGSSLKDLRVFQKLCGKDALDKVYLTTTMWDEVELNIGERRLDELMTGYWKTMISQGAQVARCRSDDDSPKQLVRKIIVSEYGTPPPQQYPVNIRQGLSSHFQEKPQRYDISRRGTPTPQQEVEHRQGPYSLEKSQRYGGAPPPVEYSQEPSSYLEQESPRNVVVHRGALALQHLPEQVPFSHPQQGPQRNDVARGGIGTSHPVDRQVQAAEEPEVVNKKAQEADNALANTPLVEFEHEPSSHPQQRPQRYDVAREGIPMSRSSVDGLEPSPQPRNVEEPPNSMGMIPSSFNIVLFGEAGVGKSSVINLIAGEEVAKISPDAAGCTMKSERYSFQVAGRTFNIWDTIGLGEPMFGETNYLSAIEQTYVLIRQIKAQGGLDLLLFCIPGSRVTTTMLCNYRLFFEVLCQKRIPIAAVVTHLENEGKMEEWWDRNEEHIRQCGLIFGGHACITGCQGHSRATESRYALELLLLSYDLGGRYPMPSTSIWFSGFLTRLGSIPRSKELKDKQKELEQLLRNRCMMNSADAEQLADNLTRLRNHRS